MERQLEFYELEFAGEKIPVARWIILCGGAEF